MPGESNQVSPVEIEGSVCPLCRDLRGEPISYYVPLKTHIGELKESKLRGCVLCTKLYDACASLLQFTVSEDTVIKVCGSTCESMHMWIMIESPGTRSP